MIELNKVCPLSLMPPIQRMPDQDKGALDGPGSSGKNQKEGRDANEEV